MSETKEFIEAATRSAQHTNGLTLTFLATAVYIGISVASATDEVLLIGRSIQLPLLNASIPIKSFFVLAPALLVVMHMHLLLQRHLLVLLLVDDHLEEAEEDPRLVFPFLLANQRPPAGAYVSPLLALLFLLIYIALPMALLLWLQLTFLRYRSPGVTAWHETLVLVDLALLWYFLGGDYLHQRAADRVLVPLRSPIAVVATLGAGFVSVFLLVGSGNGAELRQGWFPFPELGIRRHLDLADRTLVVQEPSPELVAAHPSFDQALRRLARGIRVRGSDLRGANLTNAVLVNADLRGVDLTGASLVDADLRGAVLGDSRRGATLRRANLMYADLAGAKMASVDLRFADLRNANLAMADLTGADLREARLQKADLRGAILDWSKLDLARLRDAKLSGAQLVRASLVGADFYSADLVGVSFRKANLLGTRFHSARLYGADFTEAEAAGAEFPNAHLEGTLGLRLHGLNLQSAFLGGLSSCEPEQSAFSKQSASYPLIVDFRGVRLRKANWQNLIEDMQLRLQQLAQTAGVSVDSQAAKPIQSALARLQEAREQQTCIGTSTRSKVSDPAARFSAKNLKLLYYPGQIGSDMRWWPAAIDETQFQLELAKLLKEKACSKPDVARSLVRKLADCYQPANVAPLTATARELWAELRQPWEATCSGLRPLASKYREVIQMVVEGRNDEDLREEVCR